MMKTIRKAIYLSLVLGSSWTLFAQQTNSEPEEALPPFKWVNPIVGKAPQGVTHHVFKSPSMGIDVGYCLFLPPGYEKQKNANKRYPVVYYLHGARPGSETKSIKLAPFIYEAMEAGKVAPAIYVFVNGGAVSHYNYPEKNSMGEDVTVYELIPHVDRSYRTIASRKGRGLEGFSQGGRATTRIMFRHPELFISCAPGGAGHETEHRISLEGGRESESLVFAEGYNTYDTARVYAKTKSPALNILIHVGDEGFNYQNNLRYMDFLRDLEIPFDFVVTPGAPHSATKIYEKNGLDIMKFHERNFGGN
jgi:enterochelin esterase-like enzyme